MAELRAPAALSSPPLSVDFVLGETLLIRHSLGRRVGHVVISASGPLQTWEVASDDPLRVLALRASVSMQGVRIVLV